MGGWGEFILAGLVFMSTHAIPATPRLKRFLVAALGSRGYALGFSLLSTGLLFWVIFAAGRAPHVALWPQPGWTRWAVNLVLPLVIALAAFGIAAPNPFAFEGRATGYDPAHPGIAGLTRQPLLWGLALWAGVHLLANGSLSHALVFGTFLVFSLVGMRMMEARLRRNWGGPQFDQLAARTSLLPFAALLSGRWRPVASRSEWHHSLRRLGIAIIAWALIWYLHAPVIGVSPAP